mmetsp:Transcript_87185/g.157039  ORF Transcript_87185/g.157039 Transcript_87185/m.157039 type:complete len:230 (+) Transcript_87185:783-1472(+)
MRRSSSFTETSPATPCPYPASPLLKPGSALPAPAGSGNRSFLSNNMRSTRASSDASVSHLRAAVSASAFAIAISASSFAATPHQDSRRTPGLRKASSKKATSSSLLRKAESRFRESAEDSRQLLACSSLPPNRAACSAASSASNSVRLSPANRVWVRASSILAFWRRIRCSSMANSTLRPTSSSTPPRLPPTLGLGTCFCRSFSMQSHTRSMAKSWEKLMPRLWPTLSR